MRGEPRRPTRRHSVPPSHRRVRRRLLLRSLLRDALFAASRLKRSPWNQRPGNQSAKGMQLPHPVENPVQDLPTAPAPSAGFKSTSIISASRYPTPPGAPRDQPYPESESEAGTPLRRRPAKLFRKGQLLYHKSFNGVEPITYVDTRLYEGGSNDYYEAYNRSDLRWVRRINNLLEAHNIPRWDNT